MGRKLFLSHLADSNHLVGHGIHDVRSPDEGIVLFTYVYPLHPFHKVDIQACATDLGEYPDGNSFMLCTADETVHHVIPNALQRLTESAHGKSLSDLFSEVSEALTTAVSAGTSLDNTPDEKVTGENDFDFDFEGEDSDSDFFGPVDRDAVTGTREISLDSGATAGDAMDKTTNIRADLNVLKKAGFRVGVFGNLSASGILCVSIRVSKLGLSDEALEAWNIPRKRYLVLLIRYSRGYRDATEIQAFKELSSSVQMKVGLCEHYKPSLTQVVGVFQHAKSGSVTTKEQGNNIKDPIMIDDEVVFETLFIGRAINQLLEERLFQIISARHTCGLTWLGAEKFISERQASAASSHSGDLEPYLVDDIASAQHLPSIVHGDHMTQTALKEASLPLIIMQFVLRHVVRCTEFCLVCHCRVDEDSDSIEALKPYVCLKPLCLFQYLTLGFGPSLEWEILTQPYVVDLLVSFCYAAAYSSRLKELPLGMNLMVPMTQNQSAAVTDYTTQSRYLQKQNLSAPAPPVESFTCSWDVATLRLVVKDDENCKIIAKKQADGQNKDAAMLKHVKVGDWLFLVSEDRSASAHCRVKQVNLPEISVHRPVVVGPKPIGSGQDSSSKPLEDAQFTAPLADCYLYDQHFDDIPTAAQQGAILTLLDTLPGVVEMREYLLRQQRTPDSSLKAWSDRISDPALNLLRWIVASNRSCILQVDEICGDDGSTIMGRPEDRVGGMDAWMQFRFAQGAPDKEKRFNTCVKQQALATKTAYPTLFAWHGSSVGNWHSIIRQGLRFDEVVNGRAYGNGIYMSNNAITSIGYSRPLGYGYGPGTAAWKSSALTLDKVLSLQEVVNHPNGFVSNTPHYVVGDIDWVQTRYLFIGRKTAGEVQATGAAVYKQDPARLVYNEQGTTVSVPITAISKTRRSRDSISKTENTQAKRAKTVSETDQATAERREDDGDSVISDPGDLAFLQKPLEQYDVALSESEADVESLAITNGKKRSAETTPKTDFVPGTLGLDGIKFMVQPQDATPTATKALMRLLKEALNTQEISAPADLGWYIDRNLINNMYQWVVEMHSFPKELPLAQDMKAAGLTSVVLEMRFTSQYPFSPPFIRVVKPRFLPFGQGGGGNVTDGGAMCMEVLTNNGWSASLTIESLLLQVRLLVSDTERPARLARRSGYDEQSTYGIGEAMAAYIRACQQHGWTVPAGFNTMQQ